MSVEGTKPMVCEEIQRRHCLPNDASKRPPNRIRLLDPSSKSAMRDILTKSPVDCGELLDALYDRGRRNPSFWAVHVF